MNGKNKNVPFIVNTARVPENISKSYENKFNGIDSLTVLPGFPVEVPDFNTPEVYIVKWIPTKTLK